MSHRLVLALVLVALLPALGFTGCQRRPNLPEQVTVVVERFKPLPEWAKRELPTPMPVDGTVGAHLRSEAARGGVIGIANCRARLLERLDRGEPVDAKECAQP